MNNNCRKYALILFACAALTSTDVTAQQPSEAEICESIFKEYGIQGEGCPARIEDTPRRPAASADGGKLPNPESHISFQAGGTSLSSKAKVQIEQLGKVLVTSVMRDTCVQLVGHSDSSGSAEANDELAFKRAQTVASILGQQLDDFSRIARVYSEGENKPLDDLPSTSPLNRRVEIWVRKCR